ncbi:glycosyltransferase [Streptomyces sp. M10(2022)]
MRRPFPRRPLAYRSPQVARYRVQAAKAWRSDLSFRQAATKAARAGHPGRSAGGSKARLLVPRLSAKVYSKWVALRARETTSLQKRRSMLDAPLDRSATAMWQTLMKQRSWRRLMPNLWDFELAFAKHIDAFKPDLIHSHDFKMLGVGARAAVRARASGRPVKLVWDAHEYVPGCPAPRTLAAGPCRVGEGARRVRRRGDHRLPGPGRAAQGRPRPGRAPDGRAERPGALPGRGRGGRRGPRPRPARSVRRRRGHPLLAYVGGINPVRGVETIIEGLARMPDVHVAMVSVPPGKPYAATATIRKLVDELGVGDRVHFLPFVPHWQVAEFVAPADAAVSPLHHLANHELALSNKFFEYSQARLPQIVSDIRTMSEMVTATGQGEVFRAQDTEDYVRAVKAVLADPERYRAAYERPGLLEKWTWEAQAETLDGIYGRLLPNRPKPSTPSTEARAEARA